MADYGSLDTLIVEAKKSAIDAYMRERKYVDIKGQYFRSFGEGDITVVTKPDSEGLGGGELLHGLFSRARRATRTHSTPSGRG